MKRAPFSREAPALSLILCSRNDRYRGNSLWRLRTSLNFVADKVTKLGRSSEVEILIADCGRDLPLREILALNENAARRG